MYQTLFVVAVLAASVGCGGSGKGSKSCPTDSEVVAVEAGTLEDPTFVDVYEVDQVCLSKNGAAVADAFNAAGIVVNDPSFDASQVIGLYQYDNFGTPSEPVVDLANSLWQDHGCEANPMDWGIEVDSDGKATVYQAGEGGKKFRIWSMQHADCTYKCTPDIICDETRIGTVMAYGRKDKWVLADYTVFTDAAVTTNDLPGQIAIFGERWR